MRFLTKPFFLPVTVTILAVVACSKSEEKSRTELLTGASCWAEVKNEVYDNSTNQWMPSTLDDCAKDDCRVFRTDNTTTLDAGLEKCSSNEPQTLNGTWSLSVDDRTLMITENGVGLSAEIIELTATKLVLENQFFSIRSRITFLAR